MDNQLNAYTHHGGGGQGRLDYLLVRQGTRYEIEVDTMEVEGNDFNERVDTLLCRNPNSLPLTGWVIDQPSLRCYLSDHFGLIATLRLVQP